MTQTPAPLAPARHWAAGYIGQPWTYERDCRWLVRQVQREQFDREVPALLKPVPLTDWAKVREAAAQQGWRPVDTLAREGDILVVHSAEGAHVGVFIQYGAVFGVLHAQGSINKPGSVRFDTLADLLCSGYARPQTWRHHAA